MNAGDDVSRVQVHDHQGPLFISCEDGLLPWLQGLLATLPTSFRRADGAAMADRGIHAPGGQERHDQVVRTEPISSAVPVHLISGRPGWATRAQTLMHDRSGLRAIVVIDPGVCPAQEADQLATTSRSTGVLIHLSETFAGNPVLEESRRAGLFSRDRVSGVYLSGVSRDENPRGLLLTHLRVLRSLGICDLTARAAHHRGKGLTYTAGWGDALVLGLATSARSLPTSVRVVAVGADSTTQVQLPSAATARPAEVRVNTATGGWCLPTIYQTAHRAVLGRLHADLTRTDAAHHVEDAAELVRDFAADLRTAALLIPDATTQNLSANPNFGQVAQ